jgi:hypothetical protein
MEVGAALTGAPMARRAGRLLSHVSGTPADHHQDVETSVRHAHTARISNRQCQILEFTITCRKQTTAPHANRQYFRVVNAANRVSSARPQAPHRNSNRNKTAFKNVANSLNANEKAFSNRNTNPVSTDAAPAPRRAMNARRCIYASRARRISCGQLGHDVRFRAYQSHWRTSRCIP